MANIIQNAATAAVAKKQAPTIQNYVKQMMPEIKKALPAVMTPERFTRIVLSALSSNPKLAECTPQSFLGAMMASAQLGLECNTTLGQSYLIPFRNHGVMECQFQLGYKGLIDLAYRSGDVSTVQAHIVYENDDFEYAYGLEPKLHHVPAKKERGNATHVYAVFTMKDGGYGFEVMSMDDINAHAKKFSKSFGSGPWQTNFEEMAKKTVLKKCLKYAPMKSEFVKGVANDGGVRTEISEDMFDTAPSYVDVDDTTGEVLEEVKEDVENA